MTINPFATRFIRPGTMPFIFPENKSVQGLVQRLRDAKWWGQIVGPHGSGKSTLLAALQPELETAGRRVMRHTLHQGEHRLPPIDRSTLVSDSQLVVDGYEQLGWWQKRRLKALCRRLNCGLLVTAHADAGLPDVYTTQSSLELAERIVKHLLDENSEVIVPDDIARALAATGGNMRETLFKLYDVYAHRRAAGSEQRGA